MIIDRAYTGFPEGRSLNEMQKLVWSYCDTYDNMVVCSQTSSGKTTLISMYGKKHIDNKKSIIYTGPMKALVEEQFVTWNEEGHPWKDLKKVVVTGDYIFDDTVQKDLEDADIIIITPESLCSRLRKSSSESWLKRVGLIAIDEVHDLGDGTRGGTLEATIMELTKDYPSIQFLCLSATLPNADELQRWLGNITKKTTRLIRSSYRPVPLKHTYIKHFGGSVADVESEKVTKIIELVRGKPDQQFLVFVFKKTFGEKIVEALERLGESTDFHNANKTKSARHQMETSFKNGTLRVLVCTITLAVGVNLPATNVIITSPVAGGANISASKIGQCAGRAGRPKYDTEGFVYYLLPAKDFDLHVERIRTGEPIVSNLAELSSLAAHTLGALLLDRFTNFEGFRAWYHTTFAYYQMSTSGAVAEASIEKLLVYLIDSMVKRGMIREKDSKYVLTNKGKIVAQYLLDPFSFYDMVSNLRKYFALANPRDIDLAKALAGVSGNQIPYLSTYELSQVPLIVRQNMPDIFYKHGTVYYNRLTGKEVPSAFSNINFEVYNDIDRLGQALLRVDSESERWGEADRVKQIALRVKHSCSWETAKLKAAKVTKNDAKRLEEVGITTIDEVFANKELAKRVLPPRRASKLGL